jgi:hypothetical protein
MRRIADAIRNRAVALTVWAALAWFPERIERAFARPAYHHRLAGNLLGSANAIAVSCVGL